MKKRTLFFYYLVFASFYFFNYTPVRGLDVTSPSDPSGPANPAKPAIKTSGTFLVLCTLKLQGGRVIRGRLLLNSSQLTFFSKSNAKRAVDIHSVQSIKLVSWKRKKETREYWIYYPEEYSVSIKGKVVKIDGMSPFPLKMTMFIGKKRIKNSFYCYYYSNKEADDKKNKKEAPVLSAKPFPGTVTEIIFHRSPNRKNAGLKLQEFLKIMDKTLDKD